MRTAMQILMPHTAHDWTVAGTLATIALVVFAIIVFTIYFGRKAKLERELYDPEAHPENITNAWARNRVLVKQRRSGHQV